MNTLKHFYNTADFTGEEILGLIDTALKMKNGQLSQNLTGKSLAMLFFNPSLRTRVSFIMAMQKLGGLAIDLPIKDGTYSFEFERGAVMDQGTIEHVKDAAKVLSNYCDGIAVRSSELITSSKKSAEVSSWEELKKDKVIKSFMEYASVPVINMESNVFHPCQGLADAMTIKSTPIKSRLNKKIKYVYSWVPHPKALPIATPNSQILAVCDLGLDIVLTHPPEWMLDPEIINSINTRAVEAGGSFSIEPDQKKALKEADFVCAKSWGALPYYGNWKDEKKLRDEYNHWMIDKNKMQLTNDAFFMHCLPVRRNIEVTDEVLDSNNSLVVEQAENRMWTQIAILSKLLGRVD